MIKINKKIKTVSVQSGPKIEKMQESWKRPDMLLGATYKLKPPGTDHAMYITINDTILNQGTEHESRHPYEIFINSKNMEHFQWVVALTRVLSSVFRKGGDTTFLVEELESVFDPKGGYWAGGGRYIPSIVAGIGDILRRHLTFIGLLNEELDEHQKKFIAEKMSEVAQREDVESSYPAQATLCGKCNTKAVILMDGCATCLNCGDSKCG